MDRKQRNLLFFACLMVIGSIALPSSAEAQVVYPGIPQTQRPGVPTQPKLSPYLNLLRNDSGILPPYHAFVLPRREIYQQQTRQAGEIMRLEQATYLHAAPNSGGSSRRLPTGNGGRFQSYSHFYGWNQRH
jgi:hypothetical protein